MSVQAVKLVGFGIPTSNKKGDGPITMEDLKSVKAKVVKEEKVKEEGPVFDFYWNNQRNMFNIKKHIVATNATDKDGFTFFFTEAGQLLLIQSNESHQVPALRPKFLKGPKASNTFTSEFGKFMVNDMLFKTLNENTDGDVYDLSQNHYFTLSPVDAGDETIKAFLMTEIEWAKKNPVAEAPAVDAPAAEETAAPVAEVATEEPVAAVEEAAAPVGHYAADDDEIANALLNDETAAVDYAAEVTAAPAPVGLDWNTEA